jgi:hypothetical protein
VAQHLASTGLTLEAYAPLFDRAVAANAKSFVILMVLPFALLPALVIIDRRLPFAAHLTFSLHFHAFMLLLLSIALVIPFADVLLGGAGLASQMLDDSISIGLLVLCTVYLFLAAGTVYQVKGWLRLAKTVVLVLAAVVVFLGYRLLMLLVTLYGLTP